MTCHELFCIHEINRVSSWQWTQHCTVHTLFYHNILRQLYLPNAVLFVFVLPTFLFFLFVYFSSLSYFMFIVCHISSVWCSSTEPCRLTIQIQIQAYKLWKTCDMARAKSLYTQYGAGPSIIIDLMSARPTRQAPRLIYGVTIGALAVYM